MIPYGRQDIDESDIQAVVDVLRSDFLTQGPAVPAFEDRIAEYCGAAHGVAVNSATSALHVACLALGVGPGDRVWTSPITFVASANCALYCGATVDFVDIDRRTYNMSIECLADKLERAGLAGTLPKVVITVHMCGQPCDMAGIHALSQRYGFRIIEDASHAMGASYRGERVGSCRYSDIVIFSFHPVKIMTTGEGGLAVTNDAGLAAAMRLLRSHGITRDPAEMSGEMEGAWYYEQIGLGFNYRMTDMQAALGSSQLRRVDDFVRERRRLAQRYAELTADMPLTGPWIEQQSESSFHLYVVRLNQGEGCPSRQAVFNHLRRAGIGVNVHYIPVYKQPYYKSLGHYFEPCPEAESYYQEALSLPMHPQLRDEDLTTIIAALRDGMSDTASSRG